MDSIQLIAKEIAAWLSGNSTYTTYKTQWRYLLESYVGGEEYRRAGHLTRYQLETDAEYNARLRATPLDNHCASIISVYNSFIFRNPPERHWTQPSITADPMLQDFLKDADRDGRSFNQFMKEVSTWASVFGHTWVMVSKPFTGAVTRADELALDVRPYVSILTPLTVLDWEWTRLPNGAYELSKIKYLEDVNGDVSVVKEWTATEITTAVIDESVPSISTTVQTNSFGKIPAVCVYGKRSVVRGIGISDIADIADAQRFIYNATSETDQSIRLDSHPSLVKTADTNAGVGAGAIIHMPENLDPGLKPYVLDFTGASIDKIQLAISATIESIDKMANTGAVRATQSRTMSGVAMETEFQLLNARLSEKGAALALAEEQIWNLWFEYQAQDNAVTVKYPESYNIRDVYSDLDFYLKATTATIPSITWKQELNKAIARTVITADEAVVKAIEQEIDAGTTLEPVQAVPGEGTSLMEEYLRQEIADNRRDRNQDDNNDPDIVINTGNA